MQNLHRRWLLFLDNLSILHFAHRRAQVRESSSDRAGNRRRVRVGVILLLPFGCVDAEVQNIFVAGGSKLYNKRSQ